MLKLILEEKFVDEQRKSKALIDPKVLKAIIEYGPIIVFFASYYLADLYTATAAIIITTLLVLALSLIIEGEFQ